MDNRWAVELKFHWSGLMPQLLLNQMAFANWHWTNKCDGVSFVTPQRGHVVSISGLKLWILSFVGNIFMATLHSNILNLSCILEAFESLVQFLPICSILFQYTALTECLPFGVLLAQYQVALLVLLKAFGWP